MRRLLLLLEILVAVSVFASGAEAHAEGWHSAQPLPPPAEEGQKSVGAPVPLGHIGDIEFWAPDRGLLITSGNGAIHAGLYYYNGVSWRELSTVCGGSDGRIAWAGENNFWTISDQPTGQQIGIGTSSLIDQDRSLCHFENGQVVASYAEPIGVAESYESMDAAACSGPNNCWFGGERLPAASANIGAFHLHWNGHTLSPAPSLQTPEPLLEDPGREVAHIAAFKGRFYESVQIQEGDVPAPSESVSQPFLLHRIVEGSSKPFEPLVPEGPLAEDPVIAGEQEPFSYGPAGISPGELSAFAFAGGAGGLWAIAGPLGGNARVTALQLHANSFEQIRLKDPSGVLATGEEIAGVADEPGTEDAWVSLHQRGESSSTALAHVARIQADGTVDSAEELPRAGEEVGRKGVAEAIACPAQGDCWVATSQGWLFHIGPDYPEDNDPYFQSLITYRPPDASIPFVAPEDFPEDDSGANPSSIPAPPASPSPAATEAKVRAALFSHVKAKLVDHTTLALTFTLATKSHVKLVALRKKRKVAATKRVVLTHGRHTLKLRLDPHAWPTKLDLQVQAIGAVPLVSSSTKENESTGGPTVVTTSLHVFERPLSLLPILR